MAKEYVERDKAMNVVNTWVGQPDTALRTALIHRDMNAIPAADVAPVVHARWIKCGDNQPMSCDNVYCCSNCKGNKRLEWHLKPFCEDCGARMDTNEST